MESWNISIILASIALLWNVFNSLYTWRSNKRNATKMVELEEFRYRVRDPLEDVFRRGETVIRILSQVSRQRHYSDDLENELRKQNQELMGCMAEIHDRLIDADESRFATDINWLDMYDPAEDRIMQFMDDALDESKDRASRIDSVHRCRSEFRRFKKTITMKIETQVANLAC